MSKDVKLAAAFINYEKAEIYELEDFEYFHGKGNANTIQGQIVRKFNFEEFKKMMEDNGKFAAKWKI